MRDCRVYLITPPVLAGDFADLLARTLDGGDVAAVQLRLPDADEDAVCRAADLVRPVVHARGEALILERHARLVAQTGCDGVHLGPDDMDAGEARRLLGKSPQIGVSCADSRDRALRAGEEGADYVSFGAFFPSATLPDAVPLDDTELLSWWSELMEPPVVAVGGIDAANCAPLVRAGANFLAVLSAVWGCADGPAAAVASLNAAIAAA